ncbi:MAG: TrmB family transcriptional regulator sugar-binding domain-containing protein, partial [Candidatus Micrarchaeota archaeon]
QDRGFVLIQNTRPVTYAALPVMEALHTLKKQKQEELDGEIAKIDDLGKRLEGKIKASPLPDLDAGETVWTLKGRKAIYSKIGAMIANSKKRVLIASTDEGLRRKLKIHFKEIEKARKRGVRINFVSKTDSPEAVKIAHGLFKSELPARIVVADDQALLFLSEHAADADEEVGLWMQNPRLAETLHSLSTRG